VAESLAIETAIVVGADVLGIQRCPRMARLKHPIECDTIEGSRMDAAPVTPCGQNTRTA
jgi:hypothetical protein